MTTKVACPACGYHIANITSATDVPRGTVQEETERIQSQAAGTVGEWLATVPAGRYSPAELRESFLRERKVDLSAKAFGQALMTAGATPRRGTNGSRTWVVGSPS